MRAQSTNDDEGAAVFPWPGRSYQKQQPSDNYLSVHGVVIFFAVA